ncbi:MAG: isoleucine--tRNA ligase [Candidatus Melainabacteria bacterium]|nr:isoleucine--tRNA ligase [Candidatus Melainabacteria bacterium]
MAKISEKDNTDLENRYKDTIDLPETSFPMRGNGPVREPEFQTKWKEEDIYHKGLELRAKEGADSFVLHDGPPYLSSERIHIGTALNKILKDIIIKYKTQRGFRVPYIPGYDSHGLPIENAVVKAIKGGRQAVTVPELRDKCRDFALNNLKGQEAKFKRLGILGEWDKPYVTLDPKFEAEQIKLFGEMAAKGYIYRGLKTVYWSYGAETALADAEVEYNDNHVSSAIHVKFPITELPSSCPQELQGACFVIWTTTPWTIPGNMAICLGENIDYIVAEDSGEKIVVAEALLEQVNKASEREFKASGSSFKGKDLKGIVCKHPLFDRPSPIIFGDHVTTDAGTGCVHTAPGHGQEDFMVGKEFGLEILCPVDGRGVYTSEANSYEFKSTEALEIAKSKNQSLEAKLNNLEFNGGELNFQGFHVIKQGNDLLISALKDSGALLALKKLTHSYPYCWRSKTPLLYRATEQWFASVDGFREQALTEIDKVNWIPERGRNRIYTMIQDRGDWCISRQRTWGVPIPAIYDMEDINEQGNPKAILETEIIEHVAKIFAEEGSSSWYTKPIEELLPESFKLSLRGAKGDVAISERFRIETDTMDVWFDSGSTHRTVVEARAEEFGAKLPVDLYLEGSDQHRGWFQSSLLTSVACNGFAPYQSVLTHGFVVDEKGHKMSKSLGNVVDPDDVIKKFGADILRLWVASVDYSVEIKVGDNMFKQLSDIYRNFRNTSRYMLGNLHGFNPETDKVAYKDLWSLDKLILHRLQSLQEKLTEAFDNYQFFKYYQLIQNFCSVDLSAFYFDIIKDRLYTHGTKSLSRRAAQTVLAELLSAINRLLVPVLPHLAEDVYSHSPETIKASYQGTQFFMKEGEGSILLSNWPEVNKDYVNGELANQWDKILEIREAANKEIETIRAEKVVGKSLEASLEIKAPAASIELLKSIEAELNAVMIVSEVNLIEAEKLAIKASKFDGHKCVRCWKYFKEVNKGICQTCTDAVSS